MMNKAAIAARCNACLQIGSGPLASVVPGLLFNRNLAWLS
jgi:hypothetical protein